MKKVRVLSILLLAALILTVTGCGNSDATIGKWAYIHDAETCALKIQSNGKLELDGNSYTYTKDDSSFSLTDTNGSNTDMKYVMEKDGMLIYKTTVYTCDDAAPGSIIGVWKDATTKWSFEFTDGGEFKEDGYFPGLYRVDEAAGTVKLVYNDHFEDTLIYYTREGNSLIIEYPWKMVKMD